MDSVIKIKNLTKSYNLYNKPIDRLKESLSIFRHKSYHKDFLAVNNISFEVKKGECFGIIGTNGSGKSTTLKMLTGVLNPSRGEIEINGKISALLELGAGFNMDYTGMENIYLNGMVMGYSKEEIEAKIPEIKEFADIGDFINQPVKSYSSGMFARLAFAVAINVDPDVLIVDEALSVGDIFFQSKCYKKFDEFKAKGKTIIFVTHDMTSVIKYCDRVMLLNKGEQVKIGEPSEIVNIYKKILANSYVETESDVTLEVHEFNSDELWKNKLANNPNPQIYGDGRADIIDYAILSSKNELTNSIFQGEKVTFKMKVRFNEDVLNPIFAWKLKTNKGLEITGTNTMYENVDTGLFKKGDVIIVSFETKLDLSPCQYLVDFGVTKFEKDELVIISRNHEVTTCDIVSPKQNVGVVNPNAVVKILRGKNND